MNTLPTTAERNEAIAAALLENVNGQNQHLTFSLGNETYAIGILHIKEIIEYGVLTPVPMVPKSIRGILNLRGNVLPVIDLSVRLGGAPTETNKQTCIIIAEARSGVNDETVEMGVVVDEVNDVVTFMQEDLEPAPSFGNRIRADFIRNIGKYRDRFIVILDVEHVLSVDELSSLA